jgi:hypothetical protein
MDTQWGDERDRATYCGPGNDYHYGHCLCHVAGSALCVFHDKNFGIFTTQQTRIGMKNHGA